VLVFLPILEHPSAILSFTAQKSLTKPNSKSSNLEIEALMGKKLTKLQEIKPQAKIFLTLQESMEVKFEERECVKRDGDKYGCKWSLKYGEMKSDGRMVEKHLEVARFPDREKLGLGFVEVKLGE